jgi:hypothetical protein
MANKFYFDFRDIFRAGRLGFSGKKMMMHFLGLMLGYIIYEALTYLSLIGRGITGEFWQKYGLRPVFFIAGKITTGLPLVTIILMAVGVFIWLIIYYIFSTAVAKVAIEGLRGDEFYSMKDALKFASRRWKSIFITMLALIGILIFCLFWPSLVGLLDLIPGVEQAAEHFGAPLTTFLTIPVYFIGLFLVLLVIVFAFGLLLIPSIVATTGEDTFETVYQLFSTIWNQPWRLVIYDSILTFVCALGSAVFAAISAIGMYIAFLPSMLLAKQDSSYYFADVVARSLRIIGVSSNSAAQLIPGAKLGVPMPWTLDLATFFLFACLIMIAAIVISYPLSITSSGYTILYVILRRKTTDENMLEVEEEEERRMDIEEPAEEQEKPEEPEKTEEAEEETEE